MTVARRSAWLIVRMMAAELQRQSRDGVLQDAGNIHDSGLIHVAGTVDLTQLADVTERVIRMEFSL